MSVDYQAFRPGWYARVTDIQPEASTVMHLVSEDGETWVGAPQGPPYDAPLNLTKLDGEVEPWALPDWLVRSWGADIVKLDST